MMIENIFFIILASGWLVTVSTAEQSNRSPDPVKNIFILAGQSNMAGRGGVTINNTWDGVIPPESKPSPSIVRLNAQLKWVEAVEPLHKDIDINNTNGIGPGMSFAKTLLAKNHSFGVIGLVPCAVGGTSISQWSYGGFLYNQLLIRTRAALRGGGRLRAILWYQGEADTIRLEDAYRYRRRLEKFFTDVRANLGSPQLLVIQVALATGQGPYIEEVRKGQFDTKVTNLITVDAKGLPLASDHVHLTTQAEIELGSMLAESFFQSLH